MHEFWNNFEKKLKKLGKKSKSHCQKPEVKKSCTPILKWFTHQKLYKYTPRELLHTQKWINDNLFMIHSAHKINEQWNSYHHLLDRQKIAELSITEEKYFLFA